MCEDGGKFSESFVVEVGVRQGCVMSPWLFNIFIDGCMRKMKCKGVKVGAKLRFNDEDWSVVTCLFQMTPCCWQKVRGTCRE